MADETTRPLTEENWVYWQKLVSEEHDRQVAEVTRLRIWLRYFAANYGDRHDAQKALDGAAPPSTWTDT